MGLGLESEIVGPRQKDRKSSTWEVEGVPRWRTLARCDEGRKTMTEVGEQPGKAGCRCVVLNSFVVVAAAVL